MTTTEISAAPAADRFRRLAAGLSDTVDAVPAERWDAPSPCEGWTARDVLQHVVESQSDFVGAAGVSVGEGPRVDDDPVAAWEHSRSVIQSVLDDPATADQEYAGGMGTSTLGATLGTFFCVDLVVHRWDIAHATGVDDAIPPEHMAFVSGFMSGLGDVMRSAGAFGAEIEASPGADEQTRFLAFLGREA